MNKKQIEAICDWVEDELRRMGLHGRITGGAQGNKGNDLYLRLQWEGDMPSVEQAIQIRVLLIRADVRAQNGITIMDARVDALAEVF